MAVGVAAVDRDENLRERASHDRVEPADRPEVQQPERAVREQQDVAGMRVGVEHPVDHDLPQHEFEQAARERRSVQATVLDGRLRRHYYRHAVEALHHEEPAPGQRLVERREPHEAVRVALRGRPHGREVARLDAEVELLADRRGEAVRELDGVEAGGGLRVDRRRGARPRRRRASVVHASRSTMSRSRSTTGSMPGAEP